MPRPIQPSAFSYLLPTLVQSGDNSQSSGASGWTPGGALSLQIPDNTIIGGNPRGRGAVDLQTQRTAATQVASGAGSFVAGVNNTASGSYAVAMGLSSTANNSYSFAMGQSSTASGSHSFVIGESSTASGNYSFAVGPASNASGSYAVAMGFQSQATSTGSVAFQQSTSSNTYSFAAGTSTASGIRATAMGQSTAQTNSYATAMGSSTASGLYSVAMGQGLASAQHSAAMGNGTASGIHSFATGTGTASAQASTVMGASTATVSYSTASGNSGASGTRATAMGASTASGSYSAALGNSTASGQYSAALGYSTAAQIGKFSQSGGIFAASGDAQTGMLVVRASTTDATPTVATSDGSAAGTTNQLILSNSASFAFSILVVARGPSSAAWEIKGLIRREANAASTTLVNSATTVIDNTPGWAVAVSADTTNGGLAVTVTGAAATNIRWVATAYTSEVIYA